ncbi:hypothetical protein [Ferrovibrio terrae]|uniref:hypothetical protein n=1 Tax=Ferrovibrio terrae TaxID=2594003 RepID=UPI003137B275
MNPQQFDRFILRPVLTAMAPEVPNSEAARRLLLGTASHESGGFQFIDQVTALGLANDADGPAYGLFQMEAATHDDLWRNFLQYKPAVTAKVQQFRADQPDLVRQMRSNLCYAVAVARAQFYRAKPPLPPADDLPALAAYWKQHWNTALGAGTPDQWLRHYPKGL